MKMRIDWYLWTHTATDEEHFVFEARGLPVTLRVPRSIPQSKWLGKRVDAKRDGSTFTVIATTKGNAKKLTDIC